MTPYTLLLVMRIAVLLALVALLSPILAQETDVTVSSDDAVKLGMDTYFELINETRKLLLFNWLLNTRTLLFAACIVQQTDIAYPKTEFSYKLCPVCFLFPSKQYVTSRFFRLLQVKRAGTAGYEATNILCM